jgi:hypothetical protein
MHPVNEEMWERWFAKDGRPVVKIEDMRREVFRRGVSPAGKLRQVIWPFILGVHEWNATNAERASKWQEKRYDRNQDHQGTIVLTKPLVIVIRT